MYAGQHHLRLMRGVEVIRPDFCRKSRGPYDCTFVGMGKRELRRWAAHLSIPAAARRVLGRPFDLGLVLLSNDYLAACDLSADIDLGGPTLFFSSCSAAEDLQEIPAARTVPLGNQEASRFSCPLVSLKGELGGRTLSLLADTDDAQHAQSLIHHLVKPATDLYDVLEHESIELLA